MISVTGTILNAFLICPRKAWLLARELSPDPDNELIQLGKLIADETFKDKRKEIILENIKIDLIETKKGKLIVGEIKKASTFIEAAKLQLAFYLWKLKEKDVNAEGELIIPKERKRIKIELSDELINKLKNTISEAENLIKMDKPPKPVRKSFCKNCAYKELCFA